MFDCKYNHVQGPYAHTRFFLPSDKIIVIKKTKQGHNKILLTSDEEVAVLFFEVVVWLLTLE